MDNKITKFLTDHEIWFKTVFSLFATVAALCVSISSCQISKAQADLAKQTAENSNNEKEPFFTIQSEYDSENDIVIYHLVNTGGSTRYVYVYMCPYLVIQQKDENNKVLNNEYIKLSGFYSVLNKEETTEDLLTFTDVDLSASVHETVPFMDVAIDVREDCKYANEFFSFLASWNNSDEVTTFIASDIDYYVQVGAYDYKNEHYSKDLWFTRCSMKGFSTGNTYLLPTALPDFDQLKHQHVLYEEIDSINMDTKETVDAVSTEIGNLMIKWDQTQNSDLNIQND